MNASHSVFFALIEIRTNASNSSALPMPFLDGMYLVLYKLNGRNVLKQTNTQIKDAKTKDTNTLIYLPTETNKSSA